MAKHGPEANCSHCEGWIRLAEATTPDGFNECRVCQGWGWSIGCPGCGKVWGLFNPLEKKKKKGKNKGKRKG